MTETTPAAETTNHVPAAIAAPAPAPTVDVSEALRTLGSLLQPMIDASVRAAIASAPAPVQTLDTAAVTRIVAEHIATLDRPTRIEIPARVIPEPHATGLAHKQLPELISLLASGRNVWLWGGAGTGKTYVCSQAARALGRKYSMQGAIADRYADLIGYRSVTSGDYVRTPFRESVEHGGLHLIDEIDASQDPGTPLAINAALANHLAPFPDGMVARHPDFVLIAAANTKGFGADADYVGRIRFDAAFLDRFVPLHWETDEKLEKALWPNAAPRVQEIRARVIARGIKVLVTPRASERLSSLLTGPVAAGTMTEERAERLAVGGLMTDDQWKQVRT